MFRETELVKIWLENFGPGSEFRTTSGQSLKLIRPGYRGYSWGPDFRSAVILRQGIKTGGDIEFHIHSKDWLAHGHHRDRAYDRVILHVVWEDNLSGPTMTSTGKKVPVLVAGTLPYHSEARPTYPCCGRPTVHQNENFRDALARQGDLWFRGKVKKVYNSLKNKEPEEVLYHGILQALGYSENKVAFSRLAGIMPFQALRIWASGWSMAKKLKRIRELFLFKSGIAPSSAKFMPYFMTFPEDMTPLHRSEWRFSGLRPANHPYYRILAAAELVTRYLDAGLIDKLVRNPVILKAGDIYPYKLLTAGPFAKDPASRWKTSLLGERRASIITVNIILPFAFALGRLENNYRLRKRAMDLFRRCPSTGDNIILQHFRRLWDLHLKLSAREEQGILRLEKAICSNGKCLGCPFSSG